MENQSSLPLSHPSPLPSLPFPSSPFRSPPLPSAPLPSCPSSFLSFFLFSLSHFLCSPVLSLSMVAMWKKGKCGFCPVDSGLKFRHWLLSAVWSWASYLLRDSFSHLWCDDRNMYFKSCRVKVGWNKMIYIKACSMNNDYYFQY